MVELDVHGVYLKAGIHSWGVKWLSLMSIIIVYLRLGTCWGG